MKYREIISLWSNEELSRGGLANVLGKFDKKHLAMDLRAERQEFSGVVNNWQRDGWLMEFWWRQHNWCEQGGRQIRHRSKIL